MVRTAAAEEESKQRSFSNLSPEIARGTDSSQMNKTPETVHKMPSIQEDMESDATEEVLIIEESEEEISQTDYRPFSPATNT